MCFIACVGEDVLIWKPIDFSCRVDYVRVALSSIAFQFVPLVLSQMPASLLVFRYTPRPVVLHLTDRLRW